jgi:peptidoglycan/xylan/chitin deacetylase (PgdA/CDA1 family)
MTLLHTPQFSSWARGHLLCRVEDVPGLAALTFDDGPSAVDTPRVLDLLARHDARATFFTLARHVERRPELVRRMVAEGHEVALHGDLHLPLLVLPPALIRREIERSAAAVRRAASVSARHFRPPFGLMLPSQARFVQQLGYTPVLGDVYPEDTRRPGVRRIVERVTPRLSAGSILILHDGSPIGWQGRGQTVEALAIILGHMASRALRGVSVEGLLAARSRGSSAGAPGEAGSGERVVRTEHERPARRS